MTTEFISPQEVDEKLKEDKITVIAVSANWCGPCKMMSKMVWDPINKENIDIQIFKINVDNFRNWAIDNGVSNLPTMFVYKGKQKTNILLSGFISKQEFENKVRC